jgi:hypothetical protein
VHQNIGFGISVLNFGFDTVLSVLVLVSGLGFEMKQEICLWSK